MEIVSTPSVIEEIVTDWEFHFAASEPLSLTLRPGDTMEDLPTTFVAHLQRPAGTITINGGLILWYSTHERVVRRQQAPVKGADGTDPTAP